MLRKKPKTRRGIIVGLSLLALGVGVYGLTTIFRDNIVFFYSPTEAIAKEFSLSEKVRLGGLVKAGTIQKSTDSLDISFVVTDYESDATIQYTGMVPALFREGQGIIAEGHFIDKNTFKAERLLAKHDEYYMPPEVAKSIKKKEMQYRGAAE
jgi:cytochrome c-type biogenesis protein CcmE